MKNDILCDVLGGNRVVVIKLIKEQKAYGRTQRHHTYNPTGRQKAEDKDYSGYVRHFVTPPHCKTKQNKKNLIEFHRFVYKNTHSCWGHRDSSLR